MAKKSKAKKPSRGHLPVKRTILALVLIAMIVLAVVIIAKNDWNFFKAVGSVKDFFVNFVKMPEIQKGEIK